MLTPHPFLADLMGMVLRAENADRKVLILALTRPIAISVKDIEMHCEDEHITSIC